MMVDPLWHFEILEPLVDATMVTAAHRMLSLMDHGNHMRAGITVTLDAMQSESSKRKPQLIITAPTSHHKVRESVIRVWRLAAETGVPVLHGVPGEVLLQACRMRSTSTVTDDRKLSVVSVHEFPCLEAMELATLMLERSLAPLQQVVCRRAAIAAYAMGVEGDTWGITHWAAAASRAWTWPPLTPSTGPPRPCP